MFEPEYFEIVKLRVKRFLLDDMLENFGKFASVRADLEYPECVIIRVRIGISDSFYRWVMKYGDGIEILSPKNVRAEFQENLKKVLEKYQK